MLKLIDVHSLPWVRVNTVIKNINEFYNVYNIENSIDEEKRINLWL